jgi:hypothetical protein
MMTIIGIAITLNAERGPWLLYDLALASLTIMHLLRPRRTR